ncbi:class I SAM-dependent methyltransferase [Kitasatospora sp. NBC_01266]|uniref:class I SAM-dependent methyltransferase n=1 Tax=Kitasatospora sp. NBC_01266 TaxID=2903572 RepID=UPI002E2F6558|nr:class I SAM-dependent methyltransferase [Kitasatospora sp. NBC_01266]
MTASEPASWLSLNRANWDDRTRVHAASEFYDLPGFRAGGCTLRPFELDEMGDVTGRRLLHLQCHMGQDTLSWARRGAEVTGLDFSEPAIRTARALAEQTGLADRARFVVCDVHEAPNALAGERFDLVYTGFGALVWLPDLSHWARVVASLLADGGALYLAEFHPMSETLDEDGRTVAHDYFDSSAGTFDCATTYTDGPTLTETTSVQWTHQLGSVVTALAEAGLRIDFLHEHDVTLFQRYSVLERSTPTEYRFPPGHPRTPLVYSLRATKR